MSATVAPAGGAGTSPPGTAARLRFGAARGLVRAMVGVHGLLGDPAAALLTTSGRRDPYPHHRAIRERGRLVSGATGLVSATHPVVDGVLRSSAFGSARPAHGGPWTGCRAPPCSTRCRPSGR